MGGLGSESGQYLEVLAPQFSTALVDPLAASSYPLKKVISGAGWFYGVERQGAQALPQIQSVSNEDTKAPVSNRQKGKHDTRRSTLIH